MARRGQCVSFIGGVGTETEISLLQAIVIKKKKMEISRSKRKVTEKAE